MKKSKIIVMMVAMIMALTMFAGCSSSEAPKSDAAPADTTETSDATETAGADDSLTRIQDKGVLVLGCDDQFPPMGFDDNGTLVGFDIDLAAAVAEKLGVEFEAKAIDWNAKEMELQSGKIDVIWNGYTITADRLEKVEFTKPYLRNAQMIVTKEGSDIKSVADLAGKKVGYQSSSAAEVIFDKDEELKNSVAGTQVYDTYQQALLDLKGADRIDAVICDKILIEYAMQQEPGTFAVCEEPLGEEYFGIGCPKDGVALADAIDKAIDELMEDGTIDEISNKWFAHNIVIRDAAKQTPADFE